MATLFLTADERAAEAVIAEQRCRHPIPCGLPAECERVLSRIAVAFTAGLIATLLIAPVHAQSYPTQYVATVWQTEQGLPQNSVNALVQDHDGFLWIGTFGGLARFDGQRFKFFGSAGLAGLGSLGITSLYESRSAELWVGTTGGGLARLNRGVATTYTERDGLPSPFVHSVRGDADGNVWINTSGELARFAGAKLQPYPTHRGKPVREFYLHARDGSMWFRSGEQVLRFGADGSVTTMDVGKPSVFLVREARDGSVWIAARDVYRLVRYHEGVFSDVPLPVVGSRALASLRPEFAVTMAEDASGELLLFTPAGLVRTVGATLTRVEPLPLPSNGGELPKVRSLFVDREGNLWVGLIATGLVRLRPAPLKAFGKEEGLSDSSFNAVFQDREGRIWLGGDLLYWFDGRRFHVVPGVADTTAIAQTRNGDLWFGGYGQLHRWRSGVLTRFEAGGFFVSGIFQDQKGTLWIGAAKGDRPGGLYRFRQGALEQIPGISGVQDMTKDWNGGFWAIANEGLFHFRSGKTTPDQQDVGPLHHIVHSYQDSTGTLWFTTNDGGLLRVRDGRRTAITMKDGVLSNVLLRILDDGTGSLWISSHRNVFRLSLRDLNDFADGRLPSILPVSYGITEGMKLSDCNWGNPGLWKTADGRIWVPTVRGVVAIDPDAGSRVPPPVVLEEASANKVALRRDGATSVPAGNSTFDFRFAALSFSAPEKVRYKYRLEPYDKNWFDAGNQRTAHYTNMAPGEYSFQVIAANSFGVWNNQGASIRFILRPHLYQTKWFYALCAGIFLALVWATHEFRTRQLQRDFTKFRDVIETIPAMAWTALPDGSNEFVNKRWVEFTGLSPKDTAGSGWTAVVHPDDSQAYWEKWRESLATGEPFEAEARFRCAANGDYRWFLARGIPLRSKHGTVLRWYGILTDIEDRKRAEEAREMLRELEAELAHINRVSMMGELAASIAHEVNQPLAGIVSNGSACLRWLTRDAPNLEEASEAVRDIVRDGKRAGEVIARIRALTKRTASPQEKLDLNESICEVLALLADEAKKNSVMIRTEFSDDVFPILGDRVQLQQVVMNLVMNAIEAMSGSGERAREVVITTGSTGTDQVLVSVEDSGPGLEPNAMSKVFDAFYTTKPGGMGMGLSISRSIVQNHGGRLWTTPNEGPGTSFHFTLPKCR